MVILPLPYYIFTECRKEDKTVSERNSDKQSRSSAAEISDRETLQPVENKANRLSVSQIESACDALDSQGHDVTNVAVRTALGGGSFRDIAPVIRAWKIARAGTPADANGQLPGLTGQAAQVNDAAHLPASLREPYSDLVSRMEAFAALVNAQFAEIDSQAKEHARASQELHRMAIADLQVKADERARKLRAELEDATAAAQEVEAEARHLEAEVARLAGLHQDLTTANALLVNEQAVLRDLNGQAEATNAGLREQINRLEDRYHGAVSRAAQSEERGRGLERELERVTVERQADRMAFEAQLGQSERSFTDRLNLLREEHENSVKLIEADHQGEIAARDDRIAKLAEDLERFKASDAEQRGRLSVVQEAHVAEINRLSTQITALQEEVKMLLQNQRQEPRLGEVTSESGVGKG
jgi:DNA repair exonuclease SbcCD ATPase subunit